MQDYQKVAAMGGEGFGISSFPSFNASKYKRIITVRAYLFSDNLSKALSSNGFLQSYS